MKKKKNAKHLQGDFIQCVGDLKCLKNSRNGKFYITNVPIQF